jgi:hypothetical protein
VGSHFERFPNKSDIYILHLPPFKEMLDELEKIRVIFVENVIKSRSCPSVAAGPDG